MARLAECTECGQEERAVLGALARDWDRHVADRRTGAVAAVARRGASCCGGRLLAWPFALLSAFTSAFEEDFDWLVYAGTVQLSTATAPKVAMA